MKSNECRTDFLGETLPGLLPPQLQPPAHHDHSCSTCTINPQFLTDALNTALKLFASSSASAAAWAGVRRRRAWKVILRRCGFICSLHLPLFISHVFRYTLSLLRTFHIFSDDSERNSTSLALRAKEAPALSPPASASLIHHNNRAVSAKHFRRDGKHAHTLEQ